MIEVILQGLGKFFKYIWSRYHTFENTLQAAGMMTGFVVSIILLSAGIAAVPFTGGASLLPAWIGMLAFIGIVTTTFLAAGRMIGITIDTVINFIQGDRVNNEKLATAIACVVGLIFAGLALPLNFFVVPFISSAAMIPTWEGFMIFLPVTVSTIASIGRHLGRTFDRHVKQKISIHDVINKLVSWFKRKEMVIEMNSRVTHDRLVNGHRGIEIYLGNRGDQEYKHQATKPPTAPGGWARYFDPETGKNRATVYRKMLKDKRTPKDLQKAIVLYTMLKSGRGNVLKETVRESMGYSSVVEAKEDLRKYIHQHVQPVKYRKFLHEHVIGKLGLFADKGRKFKKDGEIRDDYRLVVNNLNDVKFKVA